MQDSESAGDRGKAQAPLRLWIQQHNALYKYWLFREDREEPLSFFTTGIKKSLLIFEQAVSSQGLF